MRKVTKPHEKLHHMASATDLQIHGGLYFVLLFLVGNEKRKALILITVDLCVSSCAFMQLRVFPHNSRQLQRKSPKSDYSLDSYQSGANPGGIFDINEYGCEERETLCMM